MALPITRNDIKELLMIPTSDPACDAQIDSHISRSQPAIEYQIADGYLSDTVSAGLQALLKLGVMEVLAGEFWSQKSREEGASVVKIFSLQEDPTGEFREARALEAKGWRRLAPYLKGADGSPVIVPTDETEDGSPVFNRQVMEDW